MDLYFSQHYEVDPKVLADYGAFDISLVSDLPLFIDPFLLFNSTKPEYQVLHEGIIRYLVFLRDHAEADLDPGLIKNWYRFKEVKQNWFGFTFLGNDGHALGPKFAAALHSSLGSVLQGFGDEQVTRASHLEKLCLIGSGVGRDGMSDFTTNLIKSYLCEYTEAFAREHLDPKFCQDVPVARAAFNYSTSNPKRASY